MSKLWKLDNRDFLKGLIVAILTGVLVFVKTLLEQKGLQFSPEDWWEIASVGASAAIGYLLKNLATDDGGKIGGIIKL